MKTHMKNRAFTLIELIVTIAIIAVLASVLYAAIASAKRTGAMTREVHAARQIMGAYLTAASERGGQLLTGYAAAESATDETGAEVPNPACGRYPWRLAPYLGYQIRGTIVVNDQEKLFKIQDRADFVYRVSAEPSFGINATYVGGNYRNGLMPTGATRKRFGQFFAEHLSHVTQPAKLIVFASSRFTGVTEPFEVEHGFHMLVPPRTSKIEWKGPYDEKKPAQDFGYLDLRHNGKSVCAMLGGNVELLGEQDLLDMRRWSPQAAEADDANYILRPIQ
jgi:prepilin-type N-terminal cleavage/methylation domain-containing protein